MDWQSIPPAWAGVGKRRMEADSLDDGLIEVGIFGWNPAPLTPDFFLPGEGVWPGRWLAQASAMYKGFKAGMRMGMR